MKTVLIIAEGGNDLMIPCRVMSSVEEATTFCEDTLKLEHSGEMRYRLPELDDNPEMNKILFASYYGGCGGAYFLSIMEVEDNKPFIHWDLD